MYEMGNDFLQPNSGGKRLQDCGKENAPEVDASPYLDNELVRRTRQGDVSAFEQLFERHSKRVYNIALQMLKDESDAADTTQEVFVHAYERIGSLKSDAAFITWLKTMTVNRCRDILRKHGRTRTESLDAQIAHNDGSTTGIEIADWSNNPEQTFGKKELQETVQKAISSLSQDHREVIALYYIDGNDVSGIAGILGCPEGTVKCRLSRARAELKRKLEHYIR